MGALLATAALGGCSLAPHYVRPISAVPPSWPVGDAYLRQSEAALPTVRYTDVFRDVRLQRLIAQALAANQDLALAVANIESARAEYRIQRAQIFPEIDATGRVVVQRRSTQSGTVATGGTATGGTTGGVGGTDPSGTGGNGTGGTGTTVTGGFGRNSTTYSVNLGTTAYELDLFGRLRSLSSAAFQTYLGTEAAARATRLTIVADVASAWLTLATDRSLLAIAADTEASAAKTYQLTRARLTGGIAPRSDVRQAETILAQARSDRAALTTQVAQDLNAIQLLAGGPVDGALLPDSIESIDRSVAELPAGVSSQVLLRRPDVVQAEYELRAANARIGAARAAFFPTISLTSLAGFASTALSALFTGGAFNWSVQPSATLPIFDGGATRGNLAYARAQREAALAQYQRAIQVAFREVSDALARRGTAEQQLAAQTELQVAAEDTLALETARYREGINPYLNTLDAQRTLYQARRALAQTRLIRADNLVQLYRTLGGDQLVDAAPTR